MPKVEVSVVLPALNEAANLRVLVPQLFALSGVAEVIVVDDASHDDSLVVCSELAHSYPGRFRSLRNHVRLGLACSTLQGLKAAQSRYAIVRDSDLNHDLGTIPLLVEAAENGARLALGSRYLEGRKLVGRVNDLFSIALSAFLFRLFGKISDWTYGYYLLDCRLLEELPVGWIFQGRGEYTLRLYRTLLGRPGFCVKEVPTLVEPRGNGLSTTRVFRHGLAYLLAARELVPLPSRTHSYLDTTVDGWLSAGAGHAGSGHGSLGARARAALTKKIASAPRLAVLDLGCGNGAFTRSWLPEQIAVDGIDRNARALAMAVERGYRRALPAQLPELPPEIHGENYGGILCFEVLQYLRWEDLIRLFANCRDLAEADARLFCLVPNRNSLLHRLRRAVFPSHVDYRMSHDLALLCAAAESAGWRTVSAWGAMHGRAKAGVLRVHQPAFWHSLALLEFAPFQLTIAD